MRILVIGDLHGHSSWKSIVENETFDKVIFLGDYLDSFTLIPEVIEDNLKDLIEYKKSNMDKCILLYGNHDHSYYHGERCSGYNWHGRKLYEPLLEKMFNENLIQLIHVEDDIIYSHAGVSKYWLKEVAGLDKPEDITFEGLEGTNVGFDLLNWNCLTGYNGYGDTISQSPLWIRPNSLLKDKLENYRQIVGHTSMTEPITEDGIWFNDMMPKYYIIIEDGEINFKENKYYEKV